MCRREHSIGLFRVLAFAFSVGLTSRGVGLPLDGSGGRYWRVALAQPYQGGRLCPCSFQSRCLYFVCHQVSSDVSVAMI